MRKQQIISSQSIFSVLQSIVQLLLRYFAGVFVEVLFVMVLLTLGLSLFVGYSWQQSLLLGFVAALLNLIPYVGVFIGYVLGALMSLLIASASDIVFFSLMLKTLGVFLVVQLLDMFILQPFIYSNSVRVRPLEIFLIVLVAGALFGIIGMIIVIPSYAIIRLLAKEFYNRVIQKLSKNNN
ncbi:MAG: AI-2E family transporter [Bacteroidales bacterium]